MSDSPQLRAQLDQLRKDSDIPGASFKNLVDMARSLIKAAAETEYEAAARELFQYIRQKEAAETEEQASVSDSNEEGADYEKIISAASHMLRAKDVFEIERGIRSLTDDVLRKTDSPDIRRLVIDTLNQSIRNNPPAKDSVIETFRQDFWKQIPEVREFLRLNDDRREEEKMAGPTPGPGMHADFDLQDRLAQARRLYYAGNYYEAIDMYDEILLNSDPNNKEALERRQEAEIRIQTGEVPDNKVPVEARIAFGRAQSLERAGRYAEAKENYEYALNEARKGGPELENWKPAVDAFLRINQKEIAEETRDKATELLREDRWDEAVKEYQAVLELIPEDAQALEQIRLIKDIQAQSAKVRTELATMSGNLVDMGNLVADLLRNIRTIRPQLPDSQGLERIHNEVISKARELKTRMMERAELLIRQTEVAGSISEKKRIAEEAVKILDNATELAPSEPEIFDLLQTITTEKALLEQAVETLNKASVAVNNNTEEDRKRARDLLSQLRQYNQDQTYRGLVSNLQRQLLDEVDHQIRVGEFGEAEEVLTVIQNEPFGLLGRSDEAWRLEQDLRKKRRKPWVNGVLFGGGGIVLLVILIALARPLWAPIFSPTATPTSPPPTEVEPTATITPLPTATITLTPAPTDTPTIMITPSPTKTFCWGFFTRSAYYIYDGPGGNQGNYLTFDTTIPTKVIGTSPGWYHVEYEAAGTVITGWVPDTVFQAAGCLTATPEGN